MTHKAQWEKGGKVLQPATEPVESTSLINRKQLHACVRDVLCRKYAHTWDVCA